MTEGDPYLEISTQVYSLSWMRPYNNLSPFQYSKGLVLILVLRLTPDFQNKPAPMKTSHVQSFQPNNKRVLSQTWLRSLEINTCKAFPVRNFFTLAFSVGMWFWFGLLMQWHVGTLLQFYPMRIKTPFNHNQIVKRELTITKQQRKLLEQEVKGWDGCVGNKYCSEEKINKIQIGS